MADYYAQAEQQTQAEHNKKVQNLKSQLASNTGASQITSYRAL